MSYIDLGSIGYDLTLRKDASWSGGMASAEGDLRQLGAAMQYNERAMEKLQREIFDTSVRLREMAAAGDTASDEYKEQSRRLDELQREYKEAEAATKGFRDEIDRVKGSAGLSAQSVADGAKKMGKGFNDAANASRGASLGAAAVGAAALTAGITFESAFAEVIKATNVEGDAMRALRDEVLAASEVHPVSPDAIAEVYAMGGQLGVATEQLGGFADAAIGMSVATNLSLEEGGAQMAKFANIMGTTQREGVEGFSKLGSSLVALGNAGASTEADIMAMALRIAGAGNLVGMSEGEVLGLANALSSMGIEAEAGGSAISKTMSEIDKAVAMSGMSAKEYADTMGVSMKVAENAVANNNGAMQTWAETAGMSVGQFKKAWETDAAGALQAVFAGMGKVREEGGNLNVLLEQLGITELRQSDMMKRVSGAADLMGDSVRTGNEAWAENTAMQKEVDARYETTASKLQIIGNRARLAGMDLAEGLMPVLESLMGMAETAIGWFRGLDDTWKKFAAGAVVVTASIYPVLKVLAAVSNAVGWIAAAFAEGGALAWIIPTLSSIGSAIMGVLSAIAAAIGAPVAVVVAIIAAIAVAAFLIIKYWDEVKAFFVNLWETVSEAFANGWEAVKAGWAAFTAWLSSSWDGLVSAVTGFGAKVAAWAVSAWDATREAFSAALTALGTFLWERFGWMVGIAVQAFQGVAMMFDGVWTVIKNIFLGAILLLIDLFTGNFGKLQTDAAAIWANIQGGIATFWAGVRTLFMAGVNALVQMWTNLRTNTINLATALWTGIVAIYNRIVTSVTSTVTGLVASVVAKWNELKVTVPAAVEAMKAAVVAKYNAVKSSVVSSVASMVSSAKAKWDEMVAYAKGLPDKILGFFKALPSKMASIGRDIANGIKEGITNAWGTVLAKVGALASGIADKIREVLGIASPSRVAKDIMRWFWKGAEDGTDEKEPTVLHGIGRVAQRIAGTLSDVTGSVRFIAKPVGTQETASAGVYGSSGGQTTVYQFGDVSVVVKGDGKGLGSVPEFVNEMLRLKRMGLA